MIMFIYDNNRIIISEMKQIHSEQSIKKTKNSGRSKKGDDLNLGK